MKGPTARKGAIYPCKLAGLECAAGYIYFDAEQKSWTENSEGNPSESKKKQHKTKQSMQIQERQILGVSL